MATVWIESNEEGGGHWEYVPDAVAAAMPAPSVVGGVDEGARYVSPAPAAALPQTKAFDYTGWMKGGDFSSGANEYRGPDGKVYIYNASSMMGAPTLLSYDGSPVPQAIRDAVEAKVGPVQIGTPQQLARLLNPQDPENNSNAGGALADMLGAAKFAAMAYGAGNLFGGESILGNISAPVDATQEAAALGGFGAETSGALAPSLANTMTLGNVPGVMGQNANSWLEPLLNPAPGTIGGVDVASNIIPSVETAATGWGTLSNSVPGIMGSGLASAIVPAATTAATAAASSAIGPGNGGIDDGALSQILNDPQNAGFMDWIKGITGISDVAGLLKAIGPAIPGLLGAFASKDQSGALKEISQAQQAAEQARYEDLVRRDSERFQTLMGREDAAIARQRGDIDYARAATEPYRQRLSDLYANPDSFLTSNEVTKPVQMGTDMLMRSLSMQGNPFGSGNALQQGQSYASDQLFGKLGQEKDRLGTLGGMGPLGQSGANVPGIATNLSGNASAGSGVGTQAGSQALLGSSQANTNIWNSLGSAANSIFSPPQTLAQQFQQFKTLMGT